MLQQLRHGLPTSLAHRTGLPSAAALLNCPVHLPAATCLRACLAAASRQDITANASLHLQDWRSTNCRSFAADAGLQTSTSSGTPAATSLVVYEGPLSVTVRRLKLLSLFSCGATFAFSPALVFANSVGTPGAKVIQGRFVVVSGHIDSLWDLQASIAMLLCGFGVFTTGLMHWFTSPYVHRLVYNHATDTAEAVTLSFFARPQHTTFSPSHVQYPQSIRPQTTFAVHGKIFYLDADNFPDKQLLARLQPTDAAASHLQSHEHSSKQ